MSALTPAGFVDRNELFCHFCGEKHPPKNEFACYMCQGCKKFYTACKDGILCKRTCLNCQQKQSVKPFDDNYSKMKLQQSGFNTSKK